MYYWRVPPFRSMPVGWRNSIGSSLGRRGVRLHLPPTRGCERIALVRRSLAGHRTRYLSLARATYTETRESAARARLGRKFREGRLTCGYEYLRALSRYSHYS